MKGDAGGSTSGTENLASSRGRERVRSLAGRCHVTDDLSVAIERLRTSTQRLNTICDAAAQTIRDVEAFLEESRVGIWTSVLVRSPDPDDDDGVRVTLEYCRHHSGKHRILLVSTSRWAQETGDVSARPWAECSRDEKIESLQVLPDLLVSLANRVEERTQKAEQAVTALSALLQLPKKRKGD